MELNPGNYLPSHDSYSGHGQAAMHASFRREREGGGEKRCQSAFYQCHTPKKTKKNRVVTYCVCLSSVLVGQVSPVACLGTSAAGCERVLLVGNKCW